MNKKVKYLPRQNPIKLKPPMQTDNQKTGNYGKGSRSRKNRSIKRKGTIDSITAHTQEQMTNQISLYDAY